MTFSVLPFPPYVFHFLFIELRDNRLMIFRLFCHVPGKDRITCLTNRKCGFFT